MGVRGQPTKQLAGRVANQNRQLLLNVTIPLGLDYLHRPNVSPTEFAIRSTRSNYKEPNRSCGRRNVGGYANDRREIQPAWAYAGSGCVRNGRAHPPWPVGAAGRAHRQRAGRSATRTRRAPYPRRHRAHHGSRGARPRCGRRSCPRRNDRSSRPDDPGASRTGPRRCRHDLHSRIRGYSFPSVERPIPRLRPR